MYATSFFFRFFFLQTMLIYELMYYSTLLFLGKKGSELWDSVTSVSAAGRKKGRGKRVGRKKVTDLNRGQVLGTGKECRNNHIFTINYSRLKK